MSNENIPAKPIEKLYIRMEQARQFGKAFDEALERRILKLPPVEGRPPIAIPEAPERRQMTLREDVAGLRELEEEVKKQGEVAVAERMALVQAENDRLKAQVAELSGKPEEAAARKPTPMKPAGKVELPEGTPTKDWTRQQLIEFCRANSLPLPHKGGIGMKNLAILDHIAGELKKQNDPVIG